jgi:hypothetical protein
MAGHPIRLCATANAYYDEWRRKFRRWVDGGRQSLALNDSRHANKGRAPLIVPTPEETAKAKLIALKIDTNLSDHSPKSLPWRILAESGECRPELAEVINATRSSKHTLTPTLRRAVRITPEEKMMARGPRTFKNGAYKQLRDNTYEDANGNRLPLLPGMLFESDDMHVNEPFYVPWEKATDKCSEKFGVRLVRAQLLPVMDVATRRWLSYGFALRPNDAYRASDIQWIFAKVFKEIGIPSLAWRLEGGAWASGLVQTLKNFAPIFRARSCGSKVIENRFGMLQKLLPNCGITLGSTSPAGAARREDS